MIFGIFHEQRHCFLAHNGQSYDTHTRAPTNATAPIQDNATDSDEGIYLSVCD